eukprot:CAMPEP_0197436742 /NCGR_PEP_ID=MMETSP1175-20131217/4153_1 /TAXON_ID=1003142 /ORGANISM="Triceratium dubium, Strain CCMP147" /LENGTH=583 /DNA_ID=CAMNT_0042966115 /DNA_START=188 /DNA_END=1939 /DNA_ORIENTATION=+
MTSKLLPKDSFLLSDSTTSDDMSVASDLSHQKYPAMFNRGIIFNRPKKGYAKIDPSRKLVVGPGLRRRTRRRHSKKKVSFSVPLVTSVRFIPPSEPDEGDSDVESRFELLGLENEIKRYRKRALIDTNMNSKRRSVREKAALMEAEMNLGKRRRPRRRRKISASSSAPTDDRPRSDAPRVSFKDPLHLVRRLPPLDEDLYPDLYYSDSEIGHFRAVTRGEAVASGREFTVIENASLADVCRKTSQASSDVRLSRIDMEDLRKESPEVETNASKFVRPLDSDTMGSYEAKSRDWVEKMLAKLDCEAKQTYKGGLHRGQSRAPDSTTNTITTPDTNTLVSAHKGSVKKELPVVEMNASNLVRSHDSDIVRTNEAESRDWEQKLQAKLDCNTKETFKRMLHAESFKKERPEVEMNASNLVRSHDSDIMMANESESRDRGRAKLDYVKKETFKGRFEGSQSCDPDSTSTIPDSGYLAGAHFMHGIDSNPVPDGGGEENSSENTQLGSSADRQDVYSESYMRDHFLASSLEAAGIGTVSPRSIRHLYVGDLKGGLSEAKTAPSSLGDHWIAMPWAGGSDIKTTSAVEV